MPFVNAGIYVRVSSEEQAKHGYSIGAQIEKCRERALSLGAKNILEFRDEGVSGSILQRPGLTRLRESIRSGGIDLVVVYDPDRFARNVSHQLIITEEIDNKGVRLEFINFDWKNTPEGQMFYTIRGAISQYEREKIRERTMTGRIQKARKGKMPHGHKPYGYNYDSENAALVINEKESEVVKLMFNWIINDDIGINGIAKRLTAMGVPTKRGAKQWHKTVVKQILSNPIYKGIFYANRYNCKDYGLNKFKAPEDKVYFTLRDESEWIPIPVPKLIDEDKWERAQKVMENARRLWAGLDKKKYLLSGLVTCGDCGDNMSGVYGKHWERKYRYYTCRKNWAGSKSKGCGQRFNADILESAVWEVITNWLKDPEQLLEVMEDNPDKETLAKELINLENEMNKCAQGRAGIISMLEKSIIKEDEAVISFTRIEKRKKELETRINEIQLSLNKGQVNDLERKAWLEMAKGYLENLDRMDFDNRRAIIRQLINRVIVYSDKSVIIHGNISSIGAGELCNSNEKLIFNATCSIGS